MGWNRIDGIGGQAIADISATQEHPYGYRVRAQDDTGQQADFVYVKGIANGAAGLLATWNASTGVTALTVARAKGLVGVMMGALIADRWGWLQVTGAASVETAGDVVAGTTVYLTATAGKVDDAVVAGDIVYGANFVASRTGAGAVLVSLANPSTHDTDNA